MTSKDTERRRAYQKARYHAGKGNGPEKMRAWRAANPEKTKAIYERELEKTTKEERTLRVMDWRKANPDKVSAYKEKLRGQAQERKAERSKKEKPPGPTALEKAIYQRQYKEHARNNFPEKRRAAKAKRRAAELRATPVWADRKKVQEVYSEAQFLKEVVGGEWHVDHIVPLNSKLVCGLHVEFNLQVLPGEENEAKSNKFWPDMP